MSKRGQNEGSIYQRNDGRWTAVVSLGYRNGKRRRKSFYGDTRQEVASKLKKVLHEQQQGLPVSSDRLSFGQFAREWVEALKGSSKKYSTIKSYTEIVNQHLIPAFDRVPLPKITPSEVDAFLQERLRAGFSRRRVQYVRTVFKRILRSAKKDGIIGWNVADLSDPISVQRKEIVPLSPDQVRAMIKALSRDRLSALYTLTVAVGLRQGEALALRWDSDVDLKAGTVRIEKSLARVEGKLVVTEPKTASSRRNIALPAGVVKVLKRHRVAQEKERLFAGPRWHDAGFVFTTSIGTPLDGRNVTRAFQQLMVKAGLPKIRFHDLRHTAATLLLDQGEQTRVVMDVLGHSQIAMTMRYQHVLDAQREAAAERMDSVLFRTRKPVAVNMAVREEGAK